MTGWWSRRRPPSTETELQRLARAAQDVILSMPPAARDRAIDAVVGMFALGAGLQAIPGEFFNILGQIIRTVVVELHMPLKRSKSLDQLLAEIFAGADQLAADPRLAGIVASGGEPPAAAPAALAAVGDHGRDR